METNVVLSEDPLKLGIHTITAVQFEGDKPTGKVLNFTEAKFEIKERALRVRRAFIHYICIRTIGGFWCKYNV
ncbi:hypothetical protein [Bacillus mycoides]|uniref:hypothetical protein n=1 Tax=Bacillus mycoides TaxID=1405 RepID=UPI0011A94FD5|nr:hypothetical protein [Bacillus mycoides]